MIAKICEHCGREFQVSPSRAAQRACSKPCAGYLQPRGQRHASWKGGRVLLRSGYIYAYAPDHPRATKEGYVLEHRLVMENTIGRKLRSDEVVHHKNGDKADNRPENLELHRNHSAHLRDTGEASKAAKALDQSHRKRGHEFVCPVCGTVKYRPRSQFVPSGRAFCSRACWYAAYDRQSSH